MKLSLAGQIEEVDRELVERRRVYPRLVATRKLRESQGQYQIQRLEAVRATLLWLQANEPLIKQRLAQ